MAKVIRGGGHVIRQAVVDARQQAEAIVARAHTEAANLREAVRAEAEAEASEAAQAELAAAMIGIELARSEAIEAIRGSVAELAVAVARKLVADDLEARPERVRALVNEAMARVVRAKRCVVRAHPADLALLSGLPVELVGDDTLQRGECLVRSDLGDIDGRIETKISRILAALGGASG